MKGKDKIIVRKKLLVEDPHFGELLAINAQHELEHEIWRSEESKRIYASLTSSSCIELINASCWVAYADPFSKKRSCFEYNSTIDTSLLRNIWNRLQELFSNNYKWSDETRKNFLSVYAFHTTGIEGNILTLPQTKLVINNINLFPGFKDDTFATPLTLKSIKEIRNIRTILDGLQLSYPSKENEIMQWNVLNIPTLIDINSAILYDLNIQEGIRTQSVAIGLQKIILPLPQEVSFLLQQYLDWLNTSIKTFINKVSNDLFPNISDMLISILSIACDAHIRFVHIHPFSDGNGRSARILNAMVLKVLGLPPPIFLKEERIQYINAVSNATINLNYNLISQMHIESVQRSLTYYLELSSEQNNSSNSCMNLNQESKE